MDTIFAFGDSYSATGYDPKNGIDSIPGLGGTTSGGYNWLQYLASTDPAQPIDLYDFAYAGAVVNNTALFGSDVLVDKPDFVQQVASFQRFFAIPGGSAVQSGQIKWKTSRTLFAIWFGINDVGLETLLLEDPIEKIPQIFGTMSVLIRDLHSGGARHFLFLTVPPTQRAPAIMDLPAANVSQYESTLGLFNEALTAFTATVPLAYPDSEVTVIDTQPIFNHILDSPATSGFADSKSFCPSYGTISTNPNIFLPQCGWPLAEYVWYNGTHPSWRVHEILAGKVAQVYRH